MSTAQRVARGFHRLGPFLAAVPLLVVGTWSVFNALNAANNARLSHDEQAHLVCAKARIAAMRKTTPGQPSVRLYSAEGELSDDEQKTCKNWAAPTGRRQPRFVRCSTLSRMISAIRLNSCLPWLSGSPSRLALRSSSMALFAR
jgi:hypothetical protein